MERAEVVEKPWWRKVGRGSFRLANGKIIKPNQRFQADPEELPKHSKDLVVPLGQGNAEGDGNVAEVAKATKHAGPKFELVHKSGGWFDVANSETGKLINEKSLRQKEAQELLESLT